MREGIEKSKSPSEDREDYPLNEEEATEMMDAGSFIKGNLEIWRGQGYDVKLEPTKTPELHKITITDPKSGEIIFYEDEEVMKEAEVKLKSVLEIEREKLN